ncbi:MAG: nitrite reductase, copper-containing [Patescibacteria group bacterium]|nr:nitrite reductase, copper-containing [Patescibacteria group bacterium]
MFQALAFIWEYVVQTVGLFIAFIAAAIFIYLTLRKSHSRWMTIALVAAFLGISIFFYVPNGLPSFQYPFSTTYYGPSSTGPVLPLSHVWDFFTHFNQFEQVADISHDPNDVLPPITRTMVATDTVDITAKEVISQIAPGVYFNFWTFDGTVPGPMIRVMQGDTVVVTLHNDKTSLHPHSIDFHAVIGPGGGAPVLQTMPGESATLTFKALHPGIFVYHCASPDAANHMAHGMYGLIVVEPPGGLPKVDKEYYLMQGEFYTAGALGRQGLQIDDPQAMLDGNPQYIVFNGRVGSWPGYKMQANVGQTVRIFVGNGGVNLISSFHVIGEVLDRVYDEGSLTSQPVTNVQTTLVPPGGATAVEFTFKEPGNYTFVDHALARMDRGAWGILHATGTPDTSIYNGVVKPMAGH